jgi:hypothetical protein
MTSPVSGPSIVWNMFVNTAPADMVTAIAALFNSKAAAASATGSAGTASTNGHTGPATSSSANKGEGKMLRAIGKEQIYVLGVLFGLITLLWCYFVVLEKRRRRRK